MNEIFYLNGRLRCVIWGSRAIHDRNVVIRLRGSHMACDAAGQALSAREFLEESFRRLDMNWKKYVEIDPRYYLPAEVDLLWETQRIGSNDGGGRCQR
jgi:hypothetical protein